MATKKTTAKTKSETKLSVVASDSFMSKSGIVTIPGVKSERLTTLIIGVTPLIVHNFSHKLRGQILAKHMGEASGGREKKDPAANFEGARYRLSDGGDGIPAGGLKACVVNGFDKASGVPMTRAKGAIRVTADDQKTNLVRIITPNGPVMREDVVRNESGVVDIRHRPEFWPWAILLRIEYLPARCSAKQTLQAVAMAGFVDGLCEWRPGSKQSKSGSFGTFRLATQEEVQEYENGTLFSSARLQAAE